MSLGVVGIHSSNPRTRKVIGITEITPVGGNNPVDSGKVTLKNIRGMCTVDIISLDNGYMCSFELKGGENVLDGDLSMRNVLYIPMSNLNCTVQEIAINHYRVITPVADAGGRVYDFTFSPLASVAPQVEQTSTNVIGNNTLRVIFTKIAIVP